MAPRVIGHPEVFSAFTRNIRELILANHILSFLALLVYFKFLKYLNLSSMFRMLNEVIVDCPGRLARFAALIVVIFCGFGVGFYVGLGQTDWRFACIAREARKTGADLVKRNPMQLFLYTYYHKLRKLSLLSDDEALPEEQSILLVDLPGIVVRKWLEKKRRMQLLVDKTLR